MRVDNLIQTCRACPSQWEFKTFENRPVYVRYRWGYLSIRIGSPDGDIHSAIGGMEIYGEALGGEYDGVLEEEYLLEILSGIPDELPKGDNIE